VRVVDFSGAACTEEEEEMGWLRVGARTGRGGSEGGRGGTWAVRGV
jgi:hypothetical protein